MIDFFFGRLIEEWSGRWGILVALTLICILVIIFAKRRIRDE